MMLAALTRRCTRSLSALCLKPSASPKIQQLRHFSTPDHFDPLSNFQPSAPSSLTTELAEGIANTTQFYIRHGISNQQLQKLATDPDMVAVAKWQKMMEIYLMTQVHVIASVGYPGDEQGLAQYAQDLATCIQSCDETMRELFIEVRRDTWRELVATAFALDTTDIPTLDIVEARNLMHKVASKMMEPDILLQIQSEASKVTSMFYLRL
jgi:hypothetical protein